MPVAIWRRTRWRSKAGSRRVVPKALTAAAMAASLVHVRDEGAVVRRAHIDDVPLFQPLPVQEETMGCNWNHRHLGHALPLSIALAIRVWRFACNDYRTSR